MSHPKDRRHRFLIGKALGEKRAVGYWSGSLLWAEFNERAAYLRRNTTKLCSCSMCGNPRRLLKDKLTRQEIKANERDKNDLSDNC